MSILYQCILIMLYFDSNIKSKNTKIFKKYKTFSMIND